MLLINKERYALGKLESTRRKGGEEKPSKDQRPEFGPLQEIF